MHKGKLSAIQYSPSAKRRAFSAPFRKRKQSLNATPIIQAAAGEKYSPMPLLSCRLLICWNWKNRLGQDAMPITGAAIGIPITVRVSTLVTGPLILDIVVIPRMIIATCIRITAHWVRLNWRRTISHVKLIAAWNRAIIYGMARLHVSLVVNWDVPCGIMIKIPLMGMFRDSLCVSFDSESLCRNRCEDKKGQKNCGQWLDLLYKQRSFLTDFCLMSSWLSTWARIRWTDRPCASSNDFHEFSLLPCNHIDS